MLSDTVEHNLQLPSQLQGKPFDKSTAEMLLHKVGLDGLDWGMDAAKLSGGEKQRVALVRSLLLDPHILLLDEVTASFDEHHTLLVEDLLNEWVLERPRAYVWITHNREQRARVASEYWEFEQHFINRCALEGRV